LLFENFDRNKNKAAVLYLNKQSKSSYTLSILRPVTDRLSEDYFGSEFTKLTLDREGNMC